MAVEIRPLTGAELAAALGDLARLRIEVFRAWPYLYDGDPDYEARYLAGYGETPNAILVAALDGGRVVGASTGLPLAAHRAAEAGGSWPEGAPPVGDIFYCAESVLLPEYRGQGIGHRFFDYREAQAREAGFAWSCFAGVIRPADHPMKPAAYRPLDPFWRARGYDPLPGAIERFTWKDVGDSAETKKELQVWLKKL
ncbi:GNAT family N-acetyltransferase [Poseidonocella sp. HB161398]|uniref:GNAT family N-acetyltransferase n=1 Tax=Poseidonocella sp. HB161398 TaxID=2320855 RepID=UPI001109D39F|nr:GNAT family N-acetyltransferase [Poseidonocella sp. HB161398]